MRLVLVKPIFSAFPCTYVTDKVTETRRLHETHVWSLKISFTVEPLTELPLFFLSPLVCTLNTSSTRNKILLRSSFLSENVKRTLVDVANSILVELLDKCCGPALYYSLIRRNGCKYAIWFPSPSSSL